MLLAQALSLHQSGRRAEAEAAYRALLAAEPENAGALHALGVLRHQLGDSASAIALISQAVALGHAGAECQFNLGLAHYRLGDSPQAVAAFTRASRIKPDWPQPFYDLGNVHAAEGRFDSAARAYRAALKLRPGYVEAAVNLANVLKSAGKLDQAVAAYRRVLRDHPDLADAHNNLGAALLAQGNTAAAEAAFAAAIRLRPGFAEALGNLTTLLGRAERFEAALPVARAACQAAPANPAFAEMLADTLRALEDYDAAIKAYQAALAIQPNRYSARFGLAEARRQQHDCITAEQELAALRQELPDFWQAHHDHGNVLRDLGRFAAAEQAYRQAIALNETPQALKNLGAALRDQQRLDDALAAYTQAAAGDPRDDDIRYGLAITHLTAGRLREGFAEYDSRLAKYRVRKLPGRAWAGDNPRGRTILVTVEQGLGDAIQFVRYVPALADRGARVVLRAPAALHRLFTDFPGVAALVPREAPPPAYDAYCQLMSLPHLLRLAEPMPIPVPYLTASPDQTAAWRARLAPLPGLRVGLAWAGNPGFAADRLRSIPPPALAPLAHIAGVSFVSLQKNAAALPALPLTDPTDDLHDLADTAALIAALDLVISVDTGVAHLAGALGRPIWLLNRFDTCWRWLIGTTGSIWYPSLRQFRQTAPADWSAPLRDVAAALQALA